MIIAKNKKPILRQILSIAEFKRTLYLELLCRIIDFRFQIGNNFPKLSKKKWLRHTERLIDGEPYKGFSYLPLDYSALKAIISIIG